MFWLHVFTLLIIPKLLLLWSCCISLLRHHNKLQMNLSSPCLGYQTCLNQSPLQCHLKLALRNTSSLSTKSLMLNTDNKLDCLCLTETWHESLNYFFLNQITPTGSLILRDREAELQYLQKGHQNNHHLHNHPCISVFSTLSLQTLWYNSWSLQLSTALSSRTSPFCLIHYLQ